MTHVEPRNKNTDILMGVFIGFFLMYGYQQYETHMLQDKMRSDQIQILEAENKRLGNQESLLRQILENTKIRRPIGSAP